MKRESSCEWAAGAAFLRLRRAGGILIFLLFLAATCSNAWATQEHSDPEGFYTHQLAHIFAILSMGFLIIQIMRGAPLPMGWRFVGIAAFFFLLWNGVTFSVHALRESFPPGLYSGSQQDWTQTIDLSSVAARLYYAGRILDHLIIVGGTVAFILGIRSFRKDLEEEP